jgi:hypothetical protein
MGEEAFHIPGVIPGKRNRTRYRIGRQMRETKGKQRTEQGTDSSKDQLKIGIPVDAIASLKALPFLS